MPNEFIERLGNSITYFVYQDSHILVYPIPSSDGDVSAGNRMINFVWYRNYAEGDELNDVLTDRSGNQRDISVPPGHVAVKHVEELRAIAQRVLPEILSSVIQHTPEPFIQVIYDIEVEKMVFGRICLLETQLLQFAHMRLRVQQKLQTMDGRWTRQFEKEKFG